jgi:hypothetical protein
LTDLAGAWVQVPAGVLRAPAGAASATVGFEVSAPAGEPFAVHLDELSCLADVLFADGFEGGDPGGWSTAVPAAAR